MVLLSLVLQVAAIGLLHTYRFREGEDHFGFGWEMGRVGRSIASGHGFSNPYGDSTGPTAWEPPVYPYLIGGVFKLFGTYSDSSAWVLLVINSLFTALTCIPIFLIAQKSFGTRVGVWSAWIWALFPYAMYWSIRWVWDTTLAPLLLSLIFLVSLQMEDWPGRRGWAIYGALWGVAALSNPSMLSFLPFSGLWVWYRRHKQGLRSLGGVVLASVIFSDCSISGTPFSWHRRCLRFGAWAGLCERKDEGHGCSCGSRCPIRRFITLFSRMRGTGIRLSRNC